MLRFVREKIINPAKGVFFGKKGSNEIIGFVSVMLMVLLVVFPALYLIGQTTKGGVENTNTSLTAALDGKPLGTDGGDGQ